MSAWVRTPPDASRSNRVAIVHPIKSLYVIVMDFMKWTLTEDEQAIVTINVAHYTPTTLDELRNTIETIRSQATDLIIIFDLSNTGIIGIEEFKSISKLVLDVIDYTKNDNILRKIIIKGAGFFFKLLYKPVSLAIPREIRDMIVFS
jgi:hypothetical protein